MNDPGAPTEARRQQMLLGLLHGEARLDSAGTWLRGPASRAERGLQAYAANAGALAERALAAAFPTIAQLVGEAPFAALARALWQAQPPSRGDIALWGDALPGFVAAASQLADEPYLADVARLDWAVHLAELASDPPEHEGAAVSGLQQLGSTEPSALWLQGAAGTALVVSPHPVATIWQAHRSQQADRFAPVRQALARGAGENALVWRRGLQAQVTVLPAAHVVFTQAVLAGRSLGQALDQARDQAGPAFAFEPWLLAALRQGWLAAVQARPPDHPAAAQPADNAAK